MIIKTNELISNSLNLYSVSKESVAISDQEELNDLADYISQHNLKYFFLGEGTNVVPPEYFDGMIIKSAFKEIYNNSNDVLNVGSAVNWDELVNYSLENNIKGFENLSLIPGSVGASPIQNIGAYGVEVSSLISCIYCYDIENREFITLSNAECNFKYRSSLLKNSTLFIISIDFIIDEQRKLNTKYQSIQNYMLDNNITNDSLTNISLAKIVREIRKSVLPNHHKIFNAGSFFKNMGLDRQATRLALELTRARADNRKDDENRIVEELQKIYDLNEEQVSLLENGSQEDVAKVLGSDNLEATKTAQGYAENFQNAFRQGLSDLLHGGDLKDVLGGLLDTFTSSIIDSFASSFTDAAFENLTPMLTDVFKGIGDLGKKAGAEFDIGGMLTGIADSLKGLFSGGGSSAGGFDLGGTIMKGIGLFTGGSWFGSQGGTVPSTPFSQAGKDSVPAMLMPGEVVLSKNQLRNMDSNSSSSTQQFNINVQGDVSRQTRKEIVKMMPQITGGVNSQNKENNHRR